MVFNTHHQGIPEEEIVRPNEQSFLTKLHSSSSSSSSSDSSWGSTRSSWRVLATAILFAAAMVFVMLSSSTGDYAYSILNGGKNGQLGRSNNRGKRGNGVRKNCPGSNTPPLVLKGKRFYDSSTDEYVPIKGIAYYPRPNDGPLSNGYSHDFFKDELSSRWQEDINNMKDLGVNAVRLYAVDPSANHDSFMCALSEAGIYVTLGLLADCEGCAIGAWVGVDAEPPLCYPSSVKERGRYVIRSFSKYDNVMAFSAGNEVTIYADDGAGGPREANVPCQKKFLRDMREYVSGCTSSSDNAVLPRAVPIGVVNWDGNSQSFDQHVYYNCRTDPDDLLENAEWFGLNSYRHCDGFATTPDEIVGWLQLQSDFRAANFPGPVLFGEYGCREQGFPTMDGFETQRTWLQAEALYTPDYSDVFAGGFVFEYSAEKKVVDDNLQFQADRLGLEEPASEWPYKKFAKVQYGIGYFGPVDCQHDDGSSSGVVNGGGDGGRNNEFCKYTKYPEWDGLVETFAKSDTQTIRAQSPGVIPECPEQFQPLSFYDWPTDDEDDVELDYCLELKKNSNSNEVVVATDAPTTAAAPVTLATRIPTADPPTTTIIDSSDQPTATATNSGATGAPTIPPSASSSNSAQCSDHSKCVAQNLAGICCPTNDGVLLGCCDIISDSSDASDSDSSPWPWDDKDDKETSTEGDKSELESSAVRHRGKDLRQLWSIIASLLFVSLDCVL